MEQQILESLGEIKGMLKSEIRLNEEHRDDDKRRFGQLYVGQEAINMEIAKMKGGKAVILWLLGGGLVSIIGVLAIFLNIVKTKGLL